MTLRLRSSSPISWPARWPAAASVLAALCTIAALLGSGATPGGSSHASGATPALAADAGARIDMRVLVITDGQPMTQAIISQLDEQGTPTSIVDLADPARPVIDAAFLGDVVDGVTPRSRYQAVVLPDELGAGLAPDELQAIHDHQRRFAIRSLSAYSAPSPQLGLNAASAPTGFAGSLDGTTVQLTDAAVAAGAAFAYLERSLLIDDVDPAVNETFAAVATPLAGAAMTPLVTATIPETGEQGVLIGQIDDAGREHLFITLALNEHLPQTAVFGPGLISWLTRGTHLGLDVNQVSVDVDDVFLSDSRWDVARDCTPGGDCVAEPTSAPDIRMTADDVTRLLEWQDRTGVKLVMAYNGYGADLYRAQTGADPLADALLASKDRLRWVNHTFRHPNLGCTLDYTLVPATCQRDATGAIAFVDAATITDEIATNVAWAQAHGISVDPTYVITGEHSGLRSLPNVEIDNPNLAPALTATGVKTIASDASREPEPRLVTGAATPDVSDDVVTLPRHPMSVYYNVGTRDELVDQFIWTHSSAADGGSGACEQNPLTMTCITPPAGRAGFFDEIVDGEVNTVMRHVLGNDARPHYAHQSNLAEDGLLYTVLDAVFQRYDCIYADSAPMLNPTPAEANRHIRQISAWHQALASGTVTAYLQGGQVHLEVTGTAPVEVPITAPTGTTVAGIPVGTPYGGSNHGWLGVAPNVPTAIALPA